MPNPFGEDAHGLTAAGIDLWLTPSSGFCESETVQNFEDEFNAEG
jgi:hypothetical protein